MNRQGNLLTLVALFCATLTLCMLAYAGRTFVTDDLPPPHGLGAFGPGGDYYAKKAPAPA